LQRLHGAEAAAHDRGEAPDAQMIGEPRLGRHPVLHRHHREVGAPRLAGFRVGALWAGGAVAAAEVVHADDEEAVGIHRLARPDHVVPPADVVRVVGVVARDVVGGVERMADQNRVGTVGIEPTVGLVNQLVRVHHGPALQAEGLREFCRSRRDDAYRCRADPVVHFKRPIKNPVSLR